MWGFSTPGSLHVPNGLSMRQHTWEGGLQFDCEALSGVEEDQDYNLCQCEEELSWAPGWMF